MNKDFIVPKAQDEMTAAEFDAMMAKGLEDAQADRSQPAAEVFAALKQKFGGN